MRKPADIQYCRNGYSRMRDIVEPSCSVPALSVYAIWLPRDK